MLVRATITGTYGGQGHINVLHFQRDDVSELEYLAFAAYVDGFWIDVHRGNVDANMAWQNIRIEDRGGTRSPYDYPVSRSGVLGPSAAFCPFISACFLLRTAFPGRHGLGRHYQGGYGHTSQFSNGQWLSGTQTRLDSVAAGLYGYWCTGNAAVAEWQLCVASRSETSSGHDVTSIVGRARVATMNTRKIGRGL